MASIGKLTFVCILIFLVSLVISSTVAIPDYEDYGINSSTKKYCGPNLIQMLKELCNDEYESLPVHASKRSGQLNWTKWSYFDL